MLKIKDRDFRIKDATIKAFVVDPYWHKKYNTMGMSGLYWSLNVQCEREEFDGESWAPCVYFESMVLPISAWTHLEGQQVVWHAARDAQTGEPNGGFYVFEHGDIPKGRIGIGLREGSNFKIEWDGLCDIYFDDIYKNDVPFSLITQANFEGITVMASEYDTTETVRTRLALYTDVNTLFQGPFTLSESKYQDGIKMARCEFLPIFSD